MRFFLLGLCILVGATANSRAADMAPGCDYEWDAAKYFPAEAANFGADRRCASAPRTASRRPTLFATPVARGQAGVCYFWVSFENEPQQTEHIKRFLRMQLVGGTCHAPGRRRLSRQRQRLRRCLRGIDAALERGPLRLSADERGRPVIGHGRFRHADEDHRRTQTPQAHGDEHGRGAARHDDLARRPGPRRST